MRWTKRLKWIRASKIIIPIALAISLVFAGFSVYAREAEYFVLRVKENNGVSLALTMNRDLSEQTTFLRVPVVGGYDNATYEPDKSLLYDPDRYYNINQLPNDIAKHDGVHAVFADKERLAFFSFSFWLVNNSERAVDVDMVFNIDSMTVGNNNSDIHIDDAVRVMIVEDEPLLSENTYVVYKKPEKNEENQKLLDDNVMYRNTVNFASDLCVFKREGDLGYKNFKPAETKRFTVVIWLEGYDAECIDAIRGDSLKMSIDFTGY